MSKGNHLIPLARKNLVDAIGLLQAFENSRTGSREKNIHIIAAFHSWKLGGWSMPEMEVAYRMFPEYARMHDNEKRVILNNFYVDHLPDKDLMSKTLEREFGPDVREMGMRCYRKIQPNEIPELVPIKLDFSKIFDASKNKPVSEQIPVLS